MAASLHRWRRAASRRSHAPCTTSVIDTSAPSPHTDRVTILVVCPNELRLERLKDAIHSAGFRAISAQALDAAWTRTEFFDFGAVVIDYELKDDIAA